MPNHKLRTNKRELTNCKLKTICPEVLWITYLQVRFLFGGVVWGAIKWLRQQGLFQVLTLLPSTLLTQSLESGPQLPAWEGMALRCSFAELFFSSPLQVLMRTCL